MKLRVVALVVLLALASGAWSQARQPALAQSAVALQHKPVGANNVPQNAEGQGARATQTQELFNSVDEILKFARDDTHLPIKHEVKPRLVKRDEVESYILKNMKEDKDAQRLERSEVVLKKFGLLPRNFDLRNFLVTMLREQVAGYYDPKTNTVNLLDWVDMEQQKPVLAHELTHALQDQSFQIEKWMKEPEGAEQKEPSPSDIGNDEATAARQAVTEGQAMVVLIDYSLAPTGKTLADSPQFVEALKQTMLLGTSDSPAFRQAPIFLKETLTFPYRYGLDFTTALLQAGGRDLAYAGAFKNPPKSTREIMEPETYLSHERLEPLKMIDFDKDFAAYERFDIGAMGEFDVDVLVEQYAGRDEAAALYPHWRGGYYFAGRPKADKSAPLGVVYVSRWSSPAKAAEFAAVYAKSLAQRYKQARALGADGKVANGAPPVDSWQTLRGRHMWLTEDGKVLIEVRGDSILISESMDDATMQRVVADYWPETK